MIHLIDASPYIFRAYFSLPDSIRDGEGRASNAVYGFAQFLLSYLEKERPSHIAVAFDESLNTSFRNEEYPAYKAQRELPPPELEAQLQDCQAITRAFGIEAWSDSRYEADDLIATAIDQLRGADRRFVVVSSDKDLAQLVADDVQLWDFARNVRYDAAEVMKKFGVPPHCIADFLGLAGDAVDNIPGVSGIGPKTAAVLLRRLGSLDAILANTSAVARLDVRGAAGLARKLDEQREIAKLSRRLATVATSAPLQTELGKIAWRGIDREAFEQLAARLGFRRIVERVSGK